MNGLRTRMKMYISCMGTLTGTLTLGQSGPGSNGN